MATNKAAPAAEVQEDKKEKYWGAERNKRRRERYAGDPQYRKDVVQRARSTQFETRRALGMDVREGENCRENLGQLPSFEKREVTLGDAVVGVDRCVTAEELAGLLNRDPQVLYRWMGKDMLPRPVFEAYNDRNRKQAVYLNDEARAIIEVFSAHQESSLYYRASHVETINRIHQAVAQARQKKGATHGSHSKTAH